MDPLTFYLFCRVTMSLGYALAIGDMASTVRALFYGGREANIGWRYVIEHWKMPAFMVLRVVFGLLIVWLSVGNAFAPYVWYAIPASLIPNAILAYVVWGNFRIANTGREKARSLYQ